MVSNSAFLIKEMEEAAEKKGEKKLLIKQLTKVIGIIPDDITKKIMEMPSEKTSEIGEAIFEIKSLEQLMKYFK